MNKHFVFTATLSLLVLVTLSFLNIQPLTNKAYATTSPSFYPLAPCPTCTSPNEPSVSGAASPYPGNTNPSESISQAPCENDNARYSDNKKKKSKHKKHNGGISKLMTKFIEFIIQLLNMLLELLGGGKINMPSTSEPEPSTAPAPSIVTYVGNPNPEEPEEPEEPDQEPSPQAENPCVSNEDPDEDPDTNPSANPSQAYSVPSTAAMSGAPSAAPSGYNAAQSIDLTNWKLQLPTGSSGKVDEVLQPELATYTKDPWYVPDPSGGIRFRASVKGVTTSGSSYPRSELREMNGSTEAAWSSSTGTHTMTIEEAITAVPKTKKHVVAGQIHDGSSDVIVIRLEMPKLFVDINGTEGPTLDANYTLGKKFTVKFEVTGGKTNIYYNGATTPAHTLTKSYSSAYFKAGAYTQSNCTTDPSDCSDNNFGEVVVYKLTVTNQN